MNSQYILDIIARCVREVAPRLEAHRFQRSDALADLGIDSVDRAELVTMVLEQLSLKIPRTKVFGPANIGGLADLLLAKLQT